MGCRLQHSQNLLVLSLINKSILKNFDIIFLEKNIKIYLKQAVFFFSPKKCLQRIKFGNKHDPRLRLQLHLIFFGQSLTLLNIINIITYFENLTIGLHVLYTFNTRVKFYVNRILFTI